jgi:hypothetical protein
MALPGFNRIDPPRNPCSKQSVDQAWLRLQDMIGNLSSGAISNVLFRDVLFVDGTNGNNATAQRGSLVLKYATVQAALTAAQTGDTIWVSPGLYTEDITWPVTERLTLRGMGSYNFQMGVYPGGTYEGTTIQNATNRETVRIIPASQLQSLKIQDVNIENVNNQPAIIATGSADADMFDVLELNNVSTSDGDIRFTVANHVKLNKVTMFSNDAIRFTNVAQAEVTNCRMYSMVVDYDAVPAVAPTGGNIGIIVSDTIVDYSLTCTDIAKVVFSETTQVGSITGTLLDNAAYEWGTIWNSGRVVGNVAVTYNHTHIVGEPPVEREICRFDYAKIGGTFSFASLGSVVIGTCNMKHACLYDTTGPHTSGEDSIIDLRNAYFAQGALAVAGSGTIDRSFHMATQAAGGGMGAQAVAITPPFPLYAGADYVVTCEVGDLDSATPITISAKSNTSFSRTVNGGGTNLDIIHFNVTRRPE